MKDVNLKKTKGETNKIRVRKKRKEEKIEGEELDQKRNEITANSVFT